jgi:sensor histidine kinase YesM
MRLFNKNIRTGQLQAIIWIIVSVLDFLSNLQYGTSINALEFTILGMLFYAYIIFGNAYWLIPHFYFKKKNSAYILLLLSLLLSAIILGSMGSLYLENIQLTAKTRIIVAKVFVFHTFSAVLIFIFSVLYRLTLDYFVLNKKQDEIKAEKAQTELHLLKQQLHPHFLFNTLNNIYYVAQNGSAEAAELIERLSNIMRYFIEESTKEKVLLKDELELLKSYIELESIRMRYEMPVDLRIQGTIEDIMIPPLLLLPLVENIFKHGVDKRSKENFAEIDLRVEDGQLLFTTSNRHYQMDSTDLGRKTGLINLEKRLVLYYENNYELITEKRVDIFTVKLRINNHGN